MRLFHAQMLDENIEGSAAIYTDPSHNNLLGSVDQLSIFGITDTVSGTTPTLTVQIEESGDQVHWNNKSGTAEINAAALSATVLTTAVGRDAGTELAPSWWTSRKGLLSSEFHQCIRENHVQIHSRKTPFVG